MNTQKEVKPRPDRPLTNTNHVVVPAHGANDAQDHKYSEDQTPGHITGAREHKGEPVERVEKASTATAGRHLVSAKDGLEVAKERSKSIEANRKASAKLFDSNKLTVVPEQKKRRK